MPRNLEPPVAEVGEVGRRQAHLLCLGLLPTARCHEELDQGGRSEAPIDPELSYLIVQKISGNRYV